MQLYERFVSDEEEWERLYRIYTSNAAYQMHYYFEQALQTVTELSQFSRPEAGIQGPKAEITQHQINKLEHYRKILSGYCSMVQGEAEEQIDYIYDYQMRKTLSALYELSPTKYRSGDGKRTISTVIVSGEKDPEEKLYLRNLVKELNLDAISTLEQEAMITAIRNRYGDSYADYMQGKKGFDTKAFYEDVETVIAFYEELHPEHGRSVDRFFAQMEQDRSKDYSKDIQNIKFLAYTAKEPYRTVFCESLDQLELADYEYADTQKHSGGKLYLRLSDKDYGVYDEKGPYTTVFHEIGHGIDYLSPEIPISIEGVENASLQELLEQDVRSALRKSIDNCLKKAEYTLTEEEIEAVIDEFISAESNRDNFENENMKQVYSYIREAYGWRECVGEKDGAPVFRDVPGAEYPMVGTRNVVLSDVIGGYTNNTIGGYGSKHDQEEYWYDTEGNITGKQEKEFFAEYFSYQMTGHEEAVETTEEFFSKGSEYMQKYMDELKKIK